MRDYDDVECMQCIIDIMTREISKDIKNDSSKDYGVSRDFINLKRTNGLYELSVGNKLFVTYEAGCLNYIYGDTTGLHSVLKLVES